MIMLLSLLTEMNVMMTVICIWETELTNGFKVLIFFKF